MRHVVGLFGATQMARDASCKVFMHGHAQATHHLQNIISKKVTKSKKKRKKIN